MSEVVTYLVVSFGLGYSAGLMLLSLRRVFDVF